MLPVSGAAQFVASDAHLDFPRHSAIKPYSRFEKPAPCEKWFVGRNMLKSPSFLALAFKSSMTEGYVDHRFSPSPSWA